MLDFGYHIDVRPEVAELHEGALVVDLHNDLLTKLVHGRYRLGRRHAPAAIYNPMRLDIDLPRIRQGGVDALGCLLFAGFRHFARRRFWAQLDRFEKLLTQFPSELVQARTPTDIGAARAEGRVALFLGVEGVYPIEDDLEALDRLRTAGVVFVSPLWMRSSALGGSSTDKGHARGLSDRGRAFLRELERRGFLVDISHAADPTVADLLDSAQVAPFASHSGCRAVCNHPRNLPDDLLRALAARGGVVGIIFAANYLGGWLTATLETLADHLCHAVTVMGIDHVALGSDFDGFVPLVRGIRDIADLPRLTEVLWRRGFRQEELRKILGENFLRYWERAVAMQ